MLVKSVESDEFETIQRMVKCLVASGYFQDCKSAAQGITKALIGRDLGIPVAVSLMDIDVIKGRPSLSASLMGAMIKKSGRYNYRPKKGPNEEPGKWHSTTAVCLEFFEKMGDAWEWIGESSFTMTDAEKAGLNKNQNYKSYPRNMLFARALSNGAKWFCADVFLGAVYTPEDFGSGTGDSLPSAPVMSQPIAVEATIAKSTKTKKVVPKRKPKTKPPALPEPDTNANFVDGMSSDMAPRGMEGSTPEFTKSIATGLDLQQQDEADYEKRMMRAEQRASGPGDPQSQLDLDAMPF